MIEQSLNVYGGERGGDVGVGYRGGDVGVGYGVDLKGRIKH